MCGITGYWNIKRDALPVIIDSLKALEYRGYDSFGVATLLSHSSGKSPEKSGKIIIQKKAGSINNNSCSFQDGKIGIGHTRWATHGAVNEFNSHPHADCHERIAVVHNGIIENYNEIKKDLLGKGHIFKSDTDTEVISHLLEESLIDHDLKDSVINVSKILEGRNAFLVLDSQTGEMIASRNGSPLIIGVKGEGDEREVFVSSDIPAFLNHTNKVMYLDDGEGVVINSEPKFFSLSSGESVNKRIVSISWNNDSADKGDYEHYMLKEIMEQKDSIRRAAAQNVDELTKVSQMINDAKGVFFIGCGTAAKVCQAAEYFFSEISRKHVNFIPASEFNNYKNFLIPQTLVIAVSQSGETADVLEAIKIAKSRGSRVVSIVNNIGSSMTRVSDYCFMINAGPEKAVASTKATTSQMAVALLLAYACAGKLNEGIRSLISLAGEVNDMLNPRYIEHIKYVAEHIFKNPNIFIIGRGVNYPIALESAIKIMEVSYIHAQGFAGGELKHGPIALIEKGTPVITLFSNDSLKKEILSNAIEVKSRGAFVIGIGPENNNIFDLWIRTPPTIGVLSSIINLIPVQLLAYYLGVLNNREVDRPRNLAKSVTVK